ncbi:MAG: excinuclease ABC subunit UvrC [Dehalococcoidia bacterium]|nr:excinuclease ABC subunit UvrC [Dehalococcoidia bacterium]
MIEDTIRAKLALAPHTPGVYLFRDGTGKIIYVGKAADLCKRVRSYFGGKSGLSTKVLRLIDAAEDIEYIQAGSEQKALVLEADLIRRYRPHFNARLKDDKSFPYLEVDLGNEWPSVSVTRRRGNKDSMYFGPFASARSMHQTLHLIRKTFPLRVCRGPLPTHRTRPCLNAHLGLCPAPCVGAIDHDAYMNTVQRVVLFLQGRRGEVLKSLQQEMKQTAARLDFEQAALLRDRMKAVELVTNQYEGVTAMKGDQDIIAVAQDGDTVLVDVFSVRDGRALGRQTFPVESAGGSIPGDILRSFILGYYSRTTHVPPLLLLQHTIEDSQLIAAWLSDLRGGSVRVVTPRVGVRKKLVDNVADSAARQLAGLRAVGSVGAPNRETGLKQLKEVLLLPSPPRRIEGYDISTIQGHEPVGSMVAFIDGVPKPSEYRRFRIRHIEGQNDFAMLGEVLSRRLSRLRAASPGERRVSTGWQQVPSLIMVDGGRGQLSAALASRAAFPGCSIPIVSLAKEHEQVFVEGSAEPAPLPKDSPGLLILQAVRDEAHRFAVSYHRRLHGKSAFASVLDDVAGIGPRRKRVLRLTYESLDALRAAPADEIASKCSLPLEVAQRLKHHLEADSS